MTTPTSPAGGAGAPLGVAGGDWSSGGSDTGGGGGFSEGGAADEPEAMPTTNQSEASHTFTTDQSKTIFFFRPMMKQKKNKFKEHSIERGKRNWSREKNPPECGIRNPTKKTTVPVPSSDHVRTIQCTQVFQCSTMTSFRTWPQGAPHVYDHSHEERSTEHKFKWKKHCPKVKW